MSFKMNISLGLLLLIAVCRSLAEDDYDTMEGEQQCECGRKNQARIVHGKETGKNEYPWMTGMFTNKGHQPVCGASILTPYHALTATHCTYKNDPAHFHIRVGQHDVLNPLNNEEYPIIKFIQHEEYDTVDIINDISILLLGKEIKFSRTVHPICLPNRRVNLENQYVKVMGWGATSEGGRASPKLMEVDLKVISTEKCEVAWNYTIAPKPYKQICTHGAHKDSCNGDSGGPIIWFDPLTDRYTQVALVSYGHKCASPKPAVNTEIFLYKDWIEKHIEESKPGVRTCTRKMITE